MNFQSTVLIVAGILLVVLLIFIGYSMSQAQNQNWPPFVGQCPDYWIDGSSNGSQCINIKDLGTCNSGIAPGQHLTMDFSQDTYNGKNGLCNKYKWANNCGITWDGINGGDTNPCDASNNSTSSSSSPTFSIGQVIGIIIAIIVIAILVRVVEGFGFNKTS